MNERNNTKWSEEEDAYLLSLIQTESSHVVLLNKACLKLKRTKGAVNSRVTTIKKRITETIFPKSEEKPPEKTAVTEVFELPFTPKKSKFKVKPFTVSESDGKIVIHFEINMK
jgi:hypothetical protein